MKPVHLLCCLVVVVGVGVHHPARAESFCVSNEAALHGALASAAGNGEDDHIKIVDGIYRSAAGFSYSSGEPRSVTLTGGWSPGCVIRTASLSTLSGEFSARVLDIDSGDGAVLVESLRILSGNPPGLTRGGGMRVRTAAGDINIDRNILVQNTAASNGGVYASSDHGDIRARGNLVDGNQQLSGAAIALVALDGRIYASGNTVYGNSSSISDSTSAGLSVTVNGADPSKRAYITNNVLWNNHANGNPDLEAFGANYRYNNALVDLWTAGDTPTEVIDEIWQDPRLCLAGGGPCGLSHTPLDDSPLLNAGVNIPYGGAPSLDLVGNPRIVGGRVDVGAIENIRAIFMNDFE